MLSGRLYDLAIASRRRFDSRPDRSLTLTLTPRYDPAIAAWMLSPEEDVHEQRGSRQTDEAELHRLCARWLGGSRIHAKASAKSGARGGRSSGGALLCSSRASQVISPMKSLQLQQRRDPKPTLEPVPDADAEPVPDTEAVPDCVLDPRCVPEPDADRS